MIGDFEPNTIDIYIYYNLFYFFFQCTTDLKRTLMVGGDITNLMMLLQYL